MVALAYTVAFEGVRARCVEVQCAVTPGLPSFTIVCSNKLTNLHTLPNLRNVKALSLLIHPDVD